MSMAMKQDVMKYVKRLLLILSKSQNDADVRCYLAVARQGAGRNPNEDPRLWGQVLRDFPESMWGKYGNPSYAEWAAFSALTLFAMHQRGKNMHSDFMYQEGMSFGKAMAELTDDQERQSHRIEHRFNSAVAAKTIEELVQHLKSSISLLSSKDVPLDYVEMTGRLYDFQFPYEQTHALESWGWDFYKSYAAKELKMNENKERIDE